MDNTISLKRLDFNHVPLSLLIVIFVSVYVASLTVAYTGLLEISINHFGFPLAWKIILLQEPIFQTFSFIIDVGFWSALYYAMLWALIRLKRQLRKDVGDRFG